MREKTTAHRKYTDDVEQEVKFNRMDRMIQIFRKHAENLNRSQIGQLHLVLVEGKSKRSSSYLAGRNDANIKVIFPDDEIPDRDCSIVSQMKPGDYIVVQINDASSQVLKGIPLYHTKLTEFFGHQYYSYTNENCVKFDSML